MNNSGPSTGLVRRRSAPHIARGGVESKRHGTLVSFNCLFDPDTFESLRAHALAKQLPVAEVVRIAVELGLGDLEQDGIG